MKKTAVTCPLKSEPAIQSTSFNYQNGFIIQPISGSVKKKQDLSVLTSLLPAIFFSRSAIVIDMN